MENQRTIQTVLSLSSGELLEADDFFRDQVKREAEIFQLRGKIENQLQTNQVEYVCLFCKQPVAIRGRRSYNQSHHFFFTHPYKSEDCPIKTENPYSKEQVLCMKFNGQKEGDRHLTLKNHIGLFLEKTNGVSDVKVDEVYRDKTVSKEWRKPDVLAVYQGKKVAFELQLATTFLSVIVARTRFYKENGIFLIWVFADFSLQNDMQKFTQKDVYYNNNFNVYVLDKEAVEKSRLMNELILKCIYKEFYSVGEELFDRWSISFIKMSDLKFDYSSSNVCYLDSSEQKLRIQFEVATKRDERIKKEKAYQMERQVIPAVNYLREFYKHDHAPDYGYNPLPDINTSESVAALNQKLKFDSENVETINKLFFDRKKPNFLSFICDNGNIIVEPSLLGRNGKSVLEEILSIDDREEFRRYISFLFRLDFKMSSKDKEVLRVFFSKNSYNSSELEKENIERWAVTNLMAGIGNLDHIKDVFKIEKLVFALASLKFKKVIHFGFSNLIQVSHNMLHSHKQYGHLYLKAMKVFEQYDEQIAADKTGKLKLKIEKFYRERPRQDNRYGYVIYELFPELS